MDSIRKILNLLDPKERLQAFGLFGLFVLMALSEMAGIASILPFISILSNPESIQQNEWLRWGYDFFSFDSSTQYLFFAGIGVLIVLVVTNAIKAVTRWSTIYISQRWGESLSRRLFQKYLLQNYDFFTNRNSSELAKNVLSEVYTLTNGVIITSLDMITKMTVVSVILVFLLMMDPVLALGAFGILGALYGFIFFTLKNVLKRQALRRATAQTEKFKVVNEAFQGIKNIKLCGYEELYRKHFLFPAQTYTKSTAQSDVIGEMPRYFIEVVAFGGILLMTLYMLKQNPAGLSQALPMIALYAFAGYRLMPGVQGIYQSYTRMRFHKPALDIITKEISLETPDTSTKEGKLPYSKEIRMNEVSFSYHKDHPVLENVSFSIPARSIVGIIGKTGSGKTTLVDVILGLLTPSVGSMSIDGIEITPACRAQWQKNLSYVSQHIYLCDDSVKANIAFGYPASGVDDELLKAAASKARLHDFIEEKLPQKYDTRIGENGIRLSGGQRQRLGLARALYMDREVLVLDEATSALDPETEAEIMDSIYGLDRNKTVLIISHKPDMLKKCDFILMVEDGKVFKKSVSEALSEKGAYIYDGSSEENIAGAQNV